MVEFHSSVASAKTIARPLCAYRQGRSRAVSKSDSQLKMPIDVTVKNPWARVVSSPTNSDVITGVPQTDNIATRRVVVVIVGLARCANDIKVVPVQVERVGTACYTSGYGQLNDLITVEIIY
jgi:hypothetical protein